MLGLQLRDEFKGHRIKNTVVSLDNNASDSFLNRETNSVLEITYPSIDVLYSLEACFSTDEKRYLVIMGDRGQGKSHILGVIHHAYKNPDVLFSWLDTWKSKLSYMPKMSRTEVEYEVVTVALHEQMYEHLWSPIFEQHPEGKILEGKFLARRETNPVPSKKDLIEIFQKKPLVLILDEFQTWYENLEGKPENWAFNFIQTMSEISNEHPNLLRLIVSVRDGDSEAYKQLHRLNPYKVNFQGEASKQDRIKLLIHRLFLNRGQISNEQIKGLIDVYFNEWSRLLEKDGPDKDKMLKAQLTSWPFSQELLHILDEQLSLALNVQGTRDFIIVLAHLFKKAGESNPIITPAHFGLNDEQDPELDRLIAAIGSQQTNRLAKIALRNIIDIKQALSDECPTIADQALASLYIRSISMGKKQGATREEIQLDLSSSQKFDDNLFKDQWALICENSYNVHPVDERFQFKLDENPRTKVLAHARNAKLFTEGQDIVEIQKSIESIYAPKTAATKDYFRYCVLPEDWQTDPFREDAYRGKNPSKDILEGQPIYVFLPDPIMAENSRKLANFIGSHISRYKNLCRFVIPSKSIYKDPEIILYARAYYFSNQWKAQEEYTKLSKIFEAELSKAIVNAFDIVSIVDRWNANDANEVTFTSIDIEGKPSQLFKDINKTIEEKYFSIDDFQELIKKSVESDNLEQQKLSYLRRLVEEPRPYPARTTPWTTPNHIFDVILSGCIEGDYAIKTDAGTVQSGVDKGASHIRRDVPRPKWNRWDSVYVKPRESSMGVDLPGNSSKEDDKCDPPPINITPEERDVGGSPVIHRIWEKRESGFHKSPLELLGDIENWGVRKSNSLHDVSIQFKKVTGEQLQLILKATDEKATDTEVYLSLLMSKDEEAV